MDKLELTKEQDCRGQWVEYQLRGSLGRKRRFCLTDLTGVLLKAGQDDLILISDIN